MNETTHSFSVKRAREADFAGDGLRDFFVYRDLGIGEATRGQFGAHLIRAVRPCEAGTGRHRHGLGFQMVLQRGLRAAGDHHAGGVLDRGGKPGRLTRKAGPAS